MTTLFHPGLTTEKWQSLPYTTQILNIASELQRSRRWLQEHQLEFFQRSLERALELIDLTVFTNQGARSLRELLRLREMLGGYYVEEFKELPEFDRLFKGLTWLDPHVQKLGL